MKKVNLKKIKKTMKVLHKTQKIQNLIPAKKLNKHLFLKNQSFISRKKEITIYFFCSFLKIPQILKVKKLFKYTINQA